MILRYLSKAASHVALSSGTYFTSSILLAMMLRMAQMSLTTPAALA